MTEPCGVLIIDKPTDMTSHDAVNIMRKLYNTKKVGHTGTLDPMATGLLVILIGRAAKAAEYLVSDEKKYEAGLLLGVKYDTGDITGTVIEESNDIPESKKVFETIDSFVGKGQQIPPMYSALKIDGQKLVNLCFFAISGYETKCFHLTSKRMIFLCKCINISGSITACSTNIKYGRGFFAG